MIIFKCKYIILLNLKSNNKKRAKPDTIKRNNAFSQTTCKILVIFHINVCAHEVIHIPMCPACEIHLIKCGTGQVCGTVKASGPAKGMFSWSYRLVFNTEKMRIEQQWNKRPSEQQKMSCFFTFHYCLPFLFSN